MIVTNLIDDIIISSHNMAMNILKTYLSQNFRETLQLLIFLLSANLKFK